MARAGIVPARPPPPAPPAVSQLVLDLGPPPRPTFDNFVAGANREALVAARAVACAAGAAPSRFLYLWGPASSGRTHLLRAIAHAGADRGVAARLLGADSPPGAFVHDPTVPLWLIDDCDRLDAERQAAAFHLFDAVAAHADAALASAGARPPQHLALMPELATRLGWGLVLQMRRLSDDDTARALERTIAERGLAASADVVPWLMTHAPRDLGRLRALVDALDAYALARKRALTVPLLREFARAGPAPDPPAPVAPPAERPPPGPPGDLA